MVLNVLLRPKRLLLEFEDFCRKVEPFNDETFEQFGDERKGIEIEDPEVEYSEIPEDIENVEDNTNIVNSEYCE
ncbi:unnamed protein product [Rhizophagus irregularis]|nr:unnamed protein product [Rhizophagus irregularis]